MNQTAVYLNCSLNCTVVTKGKCTISIRIGRSSSIQFTVCVSIATDGTKLPWFAIFKGKPNGNIEKKLPSIMPAGMLGCRRIKA